MENNHPTLETCSVSDTNDETMNWMEQGLKYYRYLVWLDELKTSYLHPSTHGNIEDAIDRLLVLRDMERNPVWCGDVEKLTQMVETKVKLKKNKRERKWRSNVHTCPFIGAIAKKDSTHNTSIQNEQVVSEPTTPIE